MEGSSLDMMIQCLDFTLCITESHWTDFIEGFFFRIIHSNSNNASLEVLAEIIVTYLP